MNIRSLESKLERLRSDRDAFMQLVERAPAEQLRVRPREGKWSAIEIAEHVVIAEREVLLGLPDLSALKKEFRRSRVRRALVTAVLRLGIPVEVPSPTMRPTGTRSVRELRELWNEAEVWLRALAQRSDLRGRALFKHPIAMGLTLDDAILLDRAHIARHRSQIEAILRRVASV